jgi:hypothetical protein
MSNHHHHGHDHSGHQHEPTLYSELVCHLPFAIFSVALGLALVSFLSFNPSVVDDPRRGAHVLFHSFHFMHIVFAATGTLITYFKYSRNYLKGFLVGIIAPSIFCTLSDVILPYLGGRLLGIDMHFHFCFATELPNVLPFLLVGLLNGFILGQYHTEHVLYSLFSHATHILVSSFAAIFYLVSHGFVDWQSYIGAVFLFLIIAVVVPCTMSDIVVPMAVAQADEKK